MVRDVLANGQCASIIFNASNEIANKAFLDGQIGLTAIYDVIEFCLNKTDHIRINTIDDVIEMDNLARRVAIERLKNV